MRPGDGGAAAAVTKMYVLPLFSRAEQLPFKIPVHVPAPLDLDLFGNVKLVSAAVN